MFKAWKRAGKHLSSDPPVDLLWTRVCFCGQTTSDGTVADSPEAGEPFLTGSEEGRGPLYDITHRSHEGDRSPTENTPNQGHKAGIPFATTKDSYPNAVPIFLLRIGKRIIITFPGEATVEVGRRARARVLKIARELGVRGVTVMGLTNEFIQYITTPEEYDRQHYEGGSTIYGPAEGAALTDVLVEMARRLRDGKPAPDAYPFDPRHGVEPNGEPFGKGASSATATAQPAAQPPGSQAVFQWQGGPRGEDRPLDRRFIAIQRKAKKRLEASHRRPRRLDRLDRRSRRRLQRALADLAEGEARHVPLRGDREPLQAALESVHGRSLGTRDEPGSGPPRIPVCPGNGALKPVHYGPISGPGITPVRRPKRSAGRYF